MHTVWQDLRYALRLLRANPGFAAVAVLSLALGLGANTAIFTVIDAEVIKPLPIKNPDQLVRLNYTLPQGGWNNDFSYSAFEQIRDQNKVFSGIFASDSGGFSATIDGQAELVEGSFVSGSFNSVMGIEPILGRTFTPEDDAREKPAVALINHEYWKRRFSLAPSVVGKSITLKGVPFTIIGVTPDIAAHGRIWSEDVRVPMVFHSELALKDHTDVAIWGRLALGVTEQQATAELGGIYQRFLAAEAGSKLSPEIQRRISGSKIFLSPAGRGALRHFSSQMRIMLAVVGGVLLIACVNVANLLLARGVARRKEIAVRLVLGAGRGRLIRQLLTESVLLALLGGVLGLLLAGWAGQVMWSLTNNEPIPFSLDGRMLVFTAGISVLTGILFGVLPAMRATRLELNPALKEGHRGAGDFSWRAGQVRFGLGKALVVSQVAVSLLLLIGSGLLLRTLQKLAKEDLGFDREHILTAWVFPTLVGYEGPREINLYWKLLDRMNSIPSVHSASLSRVQLLTGYFEREVSVAAGASEPDKNVRVAGHVIAPRFFETMGVPMLLGRDFSPADSGTAPRVAIISETMARQLFPGTNPIGQRLAFSRKDSDGKDAEIVAVVKDIKSNLRDEQLHRPASAVYIPFAQAPQTFLGQAVLEIRTAGSPADAAGALRQVVQGVDKSLVLVGVQTEAEAVDEAMGGDRSLANLASLFSVLALVLTCIGLYGTMSYAVNRRAREIGIRMALGAQRSIVLKQVLGEGIVLTLIGVGFGLVGGSFLTRLIASRLYGVSAADPLTFAAVSVLVVAVALLASYIPARRAMKVDPLVALRYE